MNIKQNTIKREILLGNFCRMTLWFLFFFLMSCSSVLTRSEKTFINPFAQSDIDITLGMTKEHVHQNWGEPNLIQSPDKVKKSQQNHERWIYKNNLSLLAPITASDTRVIYFEQGRVVGWETY